ncbi:MAG: tetratricopeptide repeat protein [Candidatus Obscuribacterales bacterium]|nr:tetratricopeptide repeat protein [Candidatus Obscuribacterales bacterium]
MKRTLIHSFVCAIFCATSLTSFARTAFANDTPAEAHYHQGMKENESGQFASAVADYDQAIKLDPQYWKAYGNRSAARYNNGDYKGALSDLKIAIPHLPPNKALNDLQAMCEKALASNSTPSADMTARREMVRQLMINAQFGGDLTNPGFQIIMAARRKAGLDPMTGMPVGGGVSVPTHSFSSMDATNTNAVTARLEAMSKGVHSASPAVSTAPAQSSRVESAPSGNAVQDRLALQVANLKPMSIDTASAVPSMDSPALSSPLASSTTNSPDSSTSGLSSVNYARDPKTNMTAQDYFDRACGKGKAMDLQGALKDYDEAIKLNPSHGPAYANRGSARFNSGNPKGALEDFNKAVQLLPDNVGLRELRDRVAKSVGQ